MAPPERIWIAGMMPAPSAIMGPAAPNQEATKFHAGKERNNAANKLYGYGRQN
jgi:hypothetical protein